MKLLIIAGARPNFMKVAPIIKAAQAFNARGHSSPPPVQNPNTPTLQHSNTPTPNSPLSTRLVHTGQHYDEKMSDVFFRELGIPAPDINLEVGSGSHAVQTANIMTRFEPVVLEEKPDWVIVVGDVNSTMACTLVCAKLGIKVAHVEAGLRSFDRTMPEEVNRLVTDSIADLLLTPSEDANENLRREGVPDSKIRLVGNIMIDSLVENLEQARARRTYERLGLRPGEFIYVTLHRPSNVDHRASLQAIWDSLQRVSREIPVVFPIHPRTRKMLSDFGITPRSPDFPVLNSQLTDQLPERPSNTPILHFSNTPSAIASAKADPSLLLLDPIGYHDSLCLTEHAKLVLTDSGGLQEESTWFQTPCLTLRPNTERPVTVSVGSNQLTKIESLPADLTHSLDGGAKKGQIPPLWDGKTAERIIQNLTGN